jgi:hypothetical protein
MERQDSEPDPHHKLDPALDLEDPQQFADDKCIEYEPI